ncbi:MAG: GNAT family N-acetyltransferase [Muribaculaceae bacterium]|nr:GNAT family N-acetyltransferase [Muribaculaceae bacterium]
MNLQIRIASDKDLERIIALLGQVNDVHADGRPDLFCHGSTKYTRDELKGIIRNPKSPVFVACDENNYVVGYCFCMIKDNSESNNLRPVKTLYIDDLCVDEKFRGQHIGGDIYRFVRKYATESGFHNITLNVWSCNPSALRFYESIGMKPMKIGMEEIL